MIAYKLLRKRKDGSLGSLFINQKAIRPIGVWLTAEDHPTKGYKHRPAWHCCSSPSAPHLTHKGRVWCEVEIDQYEIMPRPKSQGGIWYLAQKMKIVREM